MTNDLKCYDFIDLCGSIVFYKIILEIKRKLSKLSLSDKEDILDPIRRHVTNYGNFGNSAGLTKILTELFRQVQLKLKHSQAFNMGHYVDADLYMAFFLIFVPEKEAKKATEGVIC